MSGAPQSENPELASADVITSHFSLTIQIQWNIRFDIIIFLAFIFITTNFCTFYHKILLLWGKLAQSKTKFLLNLSSDGKNPLTHWGRIMPTCLTGLVIICSGNGLSHVWHQAIIWTNNDLLSFGPLGTKGHEIEIKIQTFSLKKMKLKILPAKWQPFCFSPNVLTHKQLDKHGCVLSTVAPDALVLKLQTSVSTVLTKYSLYWVTFIQK